MTVKSIESEITRQIDVCIVKVLDVLPNLFHSRMDQVKTAICRHLNSVQTWEEGITNTEQKATEFAGKALQDCTVDWVSNENKRAVQKIIRDHMMAIYIILRN